MLPDHAETLAIWGIRTLDELAALPQDELTARLARALQRSAIWLAERTCMHFNQRRLHFLFVSFASLRYL